MALLYLYWRTDEILFANMVILLNKHVWDLLPWKTPLGCYMLEMQMLWRFPDYSRLLSIKQWDLHLPFSIVYSMFRRYSKKDLDPALNVSNILVDLLIQL